MARNDWIDKSPRFPGSAAEITVTGCPWFETRVAGRSEATALVRSGCLECLELCWCCWNAIALQLLVTRKFIIVQFDNLQRAQCLFEEDSDLSTAFQVKLKRI